VTSDHGHCDILRERSEAVIRLDKLLTRFRQATLGKPWSAKDEVMICPNMRASQIYVQRPTSEIIERIAADILSDSRIDQVIWRTTLTSKGAAGYTVVSSRGRIDFKRNTSETAVLDPFGGSWEWNGEPRVLELEQQGRNLLFSEYPNAFERIAGALDLAKSGEIWVTARPGCEFEVPGGKAHVGGASHGALHALDSLSPVIVAGGPTRTILPRDMRSADIAPMIMEILGIPMRYKVGDPR
jgi:hypothetical protein